MKKLYKSTKYIWIISRVVLILLFSTTILNRITETRLADIIVTLLFLLLTCSMITISIFGIIKKKPYYLLRLIVGICNASLGILISYLLLVYGTEYETHVEIGFQILPLWIILYGFYEITNGITSYKKLKLEEHN